MRQILAFAVLALGALPAAAQSSGDRYGYGPNPRAQQAALAQPLENQGVRPLAWANKTVPQAAAADAAPAGPARPQSLALAGQFNRGSAWARDLPPPPSARATGYQPAAYQPFTPQAPYFDRPQQVAALTPPPSRQAAVAAPARVAPSARPAPTEPRGPALAGGPPQAQARAQAAPAPAAPPQQQMAQAAPRTGEGVHFYSLHRAYGLTPDAIPEPPAGNHYVLMGPPDAPRAKAAGRDDNDDDNDDAPAGKPSRPF